MTSAEAYARLRALAMPVVETADALVTGRQTIKLRPVGLPHSDARGRRSVRDRA